MNQDDPKTWKVGDQIAMRPSQSGYGSGVIETDVPYPITQINDGTVYIKPKGSTWFIESGLHLFYLVRRANAEGSGECQSEPASKADELPVKPVRPCRDCGSWETPSAYIALSGRVCEDCAKKNAHTTPAPVIEQKPVCMCCTKLHFPQDVGEEICHDDPCQFTHLERLMLPIARAQFRERQRARQEAQKMQFAKNMDALYLKQIECDRGGQYFTPTQEKAYVNLTGHNFKD